MSPDPSLPDAAATRAWRAFRIASAAFFPAPLDATAFLTIASEWCDSARRLQFQHRYAALSCMRVTTALRCLTEQTRPPTTIASQAMAAAPVVP
jgi:hypothetical protein